MVRDVSLGHQFSMQLMPVLMLIGAIMSLGASFWMPPLVLISLCTILLCLWVYSMRGLRFNLGDIRFLIAPSVIIGAGFLTYYHLTPGFFDQAYHLQISNRILDRWVWEPTHQGMSYSFRPEIVSGIAAVELWLTGNTSNVYITPTLILISSALALQHLAEHYSDKKYGFLAAVIFCTFPVTIIYGRTMLLDFAVAGMIVSVFHHLELTTPTDRSRMILIGILAGIIGLTKYPYLYLGAWISLIYLLRKQTEQSKCIALGYGVIILLFLIKNQLYTGWILGPLQSQISGTMASTDSILTDNAVYTPEVFLTEFVEQWQVVLFCIALYGIVLIIKHQKEFVMNYLLLIFPAVVLHGYILNFGWPRYSTPWLALLCIGIPAAIVRSNEEFGERIKRWRIPSILITVLVINSFGPIFDTIEDMELSSKSRYEYYKGWSEIYQNVGFELSDDSTLITGMDITIGLYSQTPSFRYEDPEYSMLQAINKFEATHVFTQDSGYRYDIDVNATFLLGSPIEPVKVFSYNEYSGRLWEVEPYRMEQSDWWRNSTVEITGNGVHFGDFIWLENNSDFQMLDNTEIYRIYGTTTQLKLDEVFDVLSQRPEDLICNSVEDCSEFNRNEHLGTNLCIWMIKIDG
tara:strand:+ start:512 stop:2404 length:1893 start_codon:yes stop_codon:yes gene_type:complete